VPSNPFQWRYFWDENGRGPVVVLSLLELSAKYVSPSTMQYYVSGLRFRVVTEFVFIGTDLTPEIAICSKIFHDKH
jgi:hypothetical protein